jgi:hypothetical protein
MKKTFLYFVFVLCLCIIAYYIFNYLYPQQRFNAIYLIPQNAVYVIETDEPITSWRTISNSPIWRHLRKQAYFAEMTQSANSLTELIEANPTLFHIFGSRTITTSAHVYKEKEYDFLNIIDLGDATKLRFVQQYLTKLNIPNYTISQKEYKNFTISEFHSLTQKSSIYVVFVENLLLCSFKSELIEAAIREKDLPIIGTNQRFLEINTKISTSGLFRLYVQYGYLPAYMNCYLDKENEYVEDLSQMLRFTGADFKLSEQGKTLSMHGYTNINDSANSFLKALMLNARGKLQAQTVIPQRTAFYLSFGCKEFTKFFDTYQENLKESDEYEFYKQNIDKAEHFLGINVKENLMSWIGEEICLVQTQAKGLGTNNELALVLKANDIEIAKKNLYFVAEQIRKRTPVKFREINYQGYPINYISVKGFFKLFLGKLFSNIEKPYYTVIENYVIFSNHPQTIKNIINDYVAGNTLAKSTDFQSFIEKFRLASNIFVYTKMPILHQNLKPLVAPDTWQKMQENRNYINCFQQIGFQLSEEDDMFVTQAVVSFTDDNALWQPPAPIRIAALDTSDVPQETELVLEDLDVNKMEYRFPNGKIRIEAKIKNGLKHGYYYEYFEDGKYKIKGQYKLDERDGTWKYYNVDGSLLRKKEFKNGVQVDK